MSAKIILMFLKEIGMMLLRKVAWQVVVEQFASRAVVWGLERLRDLSTNDVCQSTADDVLGSLKGKKLKEIDRA